MADFYGESFKYSQSSDSLIGLDRSVSFKAKPSPEKRFVTNLSASRIDDLNKRVTEQDIIIANQTKRINELEHKLSILIDILERNNNIWFHQDMLNKET
jgi:uncharacterized coiled-coil protein SlyX